MTPAAQGLVIGGDERSGARGWMDVVDPATTRAIGRVANAGPVDALAALDAADRVQRSWRRSAPSDRAAILHRAAAALGARADAIARTITAESGKPLAEARAEVAYSADHLRWAAGAAERIGGRAARAPRADGWHLTVRDPVGPCLLITPWNFPAAMVARKVGPAIAAGCSMVLKPAEQTPLTALAVAGLLHEAGLPDGVLNVVTGDEPAAIASVILDDPRLRKVSFTGSTAVGQDVLRQSARNVLRTSMELGGNAPFVVFDDAELDAALAGAVIAKLRNAGQACTAANRFYVHEPLAVVFAERVAAAFAALRVGPGAEPGVDVGPLIDEPQRRRVAALVEDARRRGARELTGGGPVNEPGYFYAPSVLVDVPANSRLLHEELFGPVAPVQAFRSERELMPELRRGSHGLAAYVYTRDLGRAIRVLDALETGLVGLNRAVVSDAALPFGGVKHSGLGREGGLEGIDEYLEVKGIAIGAADVDV